MRAVRVLAPALSLGLLLGACAAQEPGGSAGPTSDGGAQAACLRGATKCDDFPTGTGGIESNPDGSVPVVGALAAGIQGPFLMSGYIVAEGPQAQLCETLAESFPPQCGGASVELDWSASGPPDGLVTEGDVSWSEQPTNVEGEIVDGVFIVR